MLPPPTSEPPQLAHLWQKPAFNDLVSCLQGLRLDLPVWNLDVSRSEVLKKQQQQQQQQQQEAAASSTAHDRREIISFLSSVIKSSLAWLDTDDERGEVWEEASKRLSERCGRTAMGEVVRCWPFTSRDGSSDAFSLAIREPPYAGDSAIGLKTWGSSYVLAQLLTQFGLGGPLRHLVSASMAGGTSAAAPVEVLELGSGTGLLGLAAACIWRADVTLTDLPTIMPNLAHNAALNRPTVEARGGRVEAAALTWGGGHDEGDLDPRFLTAHHYQLVIVADPLYDDCHPALLAGTINEQLSLDADACVLAMIPLRDETTKGLLGALRTELAGQSSALVCIDESLVPGQDDWDDGADDDDESRRVGFWWGVFKRDRPVDDS
ncbi:putative methyltransferase-domain-containing protein [Podospora appendiculata]|uniref:Methyltransferase-domain-containing protein n=1 Tax=Podospora appendiculata TaxID=314037 RepID=A0AAE1CI90_9PEZI|nr:putative methyltransferase-domain-containing protein [Podospora appendiculata]